VPRILVAGIGNIFLGDDGFGVAVAGRLLADGAGESADVVDYGIRGLHLAYELASGRYDAAILIDAVSRGGAPGDVCAIEADSSAFAPDNVLSDAHGLTPERVLAWVRMVSPERALRVVVVGCEPETLDEAMGLSPKVAASVDLAMRMVRDLVAEMSGAPACA
jgi:hydrogenase maturation protease